MLFCITINQPLLSQRLSVPNPIIAVFIFYLTSSIRLEVSWVCRVIYLGVTSSLMVPNSCVSARGYLAILPLFLLTLSTECTVCLKLVLTSYFSCM